MFKKTNCDFIDSTRNIPMNCLIEKINLFSIIKVFYVIAFVISMLFILSFAFVAEYFSILRILITTFSYTAIFLWFLNQAGKIRLPFSRIYSKGKRGIRIFLLLSFQVACLFIFVPFFCEFSCMLASTASVDPSQTLIEVENGFWIFNTLLLIPVVEELIYRFVLYNKIKFRFGLKSALIITSVVFALFHFMNGWQNVVYTLFLGFFYSIIYEYTGSIISSTLLHILNNVLIFGLIFLPENLLNDIFLSKNIFIFFSVSSLISFLCFLYIIWFFAACVSKIKVDYKLIPGK